MTQSNKDYMPLSVVPTGSPTTVAASATTIHIGASSPPRIDLVNLHLNNSGTTTLDATVSLGAAPTLVLQVPPKSTVNVFENQPVQFGKAVLVTGSSTGLRAYGYVNERSNIF